MQYVNFETYEKTKIDFIKKNGGIGKIETSNIIDNVYHKTYICENGKCFHERIETYKTTTTNVHSELYGDFETTITGTLTEFWNDENATSKIYFEKY